MKIIIGSTFALLIACLFISYSSMKQGVINNPEELEIARLEKRQAQLEAALAKGAANSPSFENTFTPQNPLEKAAQTQADMNELQRVREELKELKEARDAIEDKAAEVIEDALEATPSPKKGRANLVKTALVMARVTEYDNVNKIAGIEILRVGNVNTGDVLGIRRNSGIIGRLTIGTIDRNQGIADPLPASFMGGNVDIQAGDELILPPDF
ncbi:hypothetical protein ACFSW8_07880 [Rubritalea tangerina]|uniref:Uncharacterized protein n=2 Tax=Rubritalea tangerina TaxID=430798 RepID=A0ABW4ZAF3_9BACT